MLEDTEPDSCGFIGSCPRLSGIISENMRTEYCHQQTSECVGNAVMKKQGIITDSFKLYVAIRNLV